MKKYIYLSLRYLLLLILGLNLWLFYAVLKPLTIYPSFLLIKFFYNSAILSGSSIIISGFNIEIIDACIAGSAFLLLLILNLTTPMNLKTRFYSLLFSLLSLLLINILRIFLLSILFIESFSLFDMTHKFFWYFLSIIFVFLIWILTIKLFKIKKIPVYSDIKSLFPTLT
jgi:exosortase/archaeosortase family protein